MRIRSRLVALALAVCLSGLWAQSPEETRAAELEALVESVAAEVTPAFVFIGGGSGVLISPDGYMLTNHHVAGSQSRWNVYLTGGRQYSARVVGQDSYGDICLLKLEDAEDLPYVELGNSDALMAGEYVFAVGNPFALGNQDFQPTVTLGVVSAIHIFFANYTDAIQTDTSINPGNSGGPLFTLEGKLVGINGMISARFGERVNSGVGFAIPSAQIERFLPDLRAAEGDEVRHGTIDGLTLSEQSTGGRGAIVANVRRRSAADNAGFQKGDRLVSIEQYAIPNEARARGFILAWPAGSEVNLLVDREGVEHELTVTLGGRGQRSPRPAARVRLGVYLAEGDGVRVERVVEDSVADSSGVLPGDSILAVDGTEISSRADLLAVLGDLSPGDAVAARIERDGAELELDLAFPVD